MEIRINRKFVILGTAVVAVFAAALLFLPQFLQPAEAQDAAGPIAEKYARAYFAADYRNKGAWLEGVQATMSEDGFALFGMQYEPVVWPAITEATIQNNAKDIKAVAEPSAMVAGTTSLGGVDGEYQIRKVVVTFENGARWPNIVSPYAMYVMLNREGSNGEWAVSMTLTERSVEQIRSAQEGTK